MVRLSLSKHPLVAHLMSELRELSTPPARFRSLTHRISQILFLEASAELALSSKRVQTPLEEIPNSPVLRDSISLISIMRAGNAMLEAGLEVFDFASCGHIGLYRQENAKSIVEYFCKLPSAVDQSQVFLLDPMLATGSSAVAAIERLKEYGVRELKFLCLVAAPEALKKLEAIKDISIQVYAAALDRELNSRAYILPGLGDAGDRIYATPHS